MLVSVVFSFRNEEENIPELVERVSATFNTIPDVKYEMVFVNDDSNDNSQALLKDLIKTYPIKLINMSRRFGVTPCVLAGFAHTKGEAVIYMDTDLQDPPELIPQMIEKYKQGADVVHTTRTHRDGETAAKMWITKRAYRVINFFSDIHLPENTGDFKLLSRKVVNELLKLKEVDPYMRGLSLWVGYRQEFIYYRRQARFGGHTHMPLFGKGPAREFVRGLTAFSSTPLFISFYLGLATIVFAFGLAMYAALTKILGYAAEGSAGILMAIAFFSGVILLTNGVVGLYVARIYNEVKARPKYIIKDIISNENV